MPKEVFDSFSLARCVKVGEGIERSKRFGEIKEDESQGKAFATTGEGEAGKAASSGRRPSPCRQGLQ